MPGFIANLGMQAAQQATGAGMGLLLGAHERKQQVKQQQKLQALQIQGQKEMADYNFSKQLQMWKDTNYGAQVEQMKQAGLSPGLIYGMSGGGATTTGGGGAGVTGGQAAPIGPAAGMGIAMGNMQLQLLDAQKKNIDADTKNKEADTTKKGAEIPNIQADTRLKEVQEENQNIANEIAGATQNAQKALIFQAMRTSWEEMEMAKTRNKWTDQMMQAEFKKITADIVEAYAKATLAREQAKLPEAQRQQITEAIRQKWSEIDIQAGQQMINKQLADFETEFGKQYGAIFATIIQALRGR